MTGDPAFSMFNLSLTEEWVNNKKFCHRLSDDEDDGDQHGSENAAQEAKDRLEATKSRQSSPNGTNVAMSEAAAMEDGTESTVSSVEPEKA